MEEKFDKPDQLTPPKSRRRWLRFSLRTMMVVITLLCVWLGVICTRANRQRRAVETIRKAVGGVLYDFEISEDGLPVWNSPPPGPDWLRNLIGIDYFATVTGVSTSNETNANDVVEVLADLPQLNHFCLLGPRITDSVMARLKGLAQLQTLVVQDTSITDAGWEPLKHLSQLKRLALIGPNVNDSTLLHIEGLTQLDGMWLYNNKITDAGLPHLKRLSHLEFLFILGTKITADGVKKLKRVLPNLNVTVPDPILPPLHASVPD